MHTLQSGIMGWGSGRQCCSFSLKASGLQQSFLLPVFLFCSGLQQAFMRPTHVIEGNLIYSGSTDLNANRIQKYSHETHRTIFDQNIWALHGPAKFTYKLTITVWKNCYGHTTLNKSNPVRSWKLSRVGPG